MKKGILLAGSILIVVAGAATGAEPVSQSSDTQPQFEPWPYGQSALQLHVRPIPTLAQLQGESGDLYRDHEASIDLFGTGTLDEHDIDRLSGRRIHNNGRLGLGAGGTVFLTRNLGLMGDAYSENPDGHFVDAASGSVVLRFPLGETGLAPYIFGGGGHQFDPQPATTAHGGAGLEFRFLPNVAVFVDARWVFTDNIGNYGLGRTGFRFAF